MTLPSLPVLLFMLVGLLSPAAAVASTDDPAAPPGAEALQPQPDDSELTSFVAAFVRLVGVQHGYMVMMQDEADPVRIEEMKRHALEDMTQAVQSQGLTVERFNAIATALNNDPQLQGRVESILRQMAAAPDDDGE